jgi:predicted SAM-dependent methyltransferase
MKPSGRAKHITRKLHIGGKIPTPGWEILNIIPDSHVDHIGNANDLSQFSDCTFNTIYASHVLEHFDYKQELLSTLKEWNRVLKPFGWLYISVPDLDVLAKLLLDKKRLDIAERFHVIRMIFGGHTDAHDYHLTGFTEELLEYYLLKAGFNATIKVNKFDIFEDASGLSFKDELISLNMVSRKY